MSETYQVCGCGVWTLTPGQETHNEPRKYGVVTHRRGQPCIATPNKSPDSEMVEWTWRTRAEAAEAALQRVRAVIRICDFEVDPASDGESLGESVVVVPVHNLLLALDGHE